VQDLCDSGSLADLVSASGNGTQSRSGPPGMSGSGGGKHRLGRLRASICCSADPEQRMLANLLCLLDVASGLDYLHSCCNMVHGDLKSANCLLRSVPAYTDRRGVKCMLADFGLSRLLNPDETSIHTGSTGTPGFAAPELLTDGKLTKAADIYSLGIIMWSLVARASPHPGSNPLSIIYLVAHQRFRPPIPEGCPPALADLMQRCWAHDAAQRPTADEVVRDLRSLLRSHARELAAVAV
jgi:serine/threonine protein kinase